MNLFLIILTIVLSLGVGWSIGANDAANSLGTAVGAKVLTLKQAILLIVFFGFLGAFLQGGHVVKTIGNGIVALNTLDKTTALYLALTACFATTLWVIIATYWKIPVSTSHSVVGAIAGGGAALRVAVEWKMFLDIFFCWIFTPIGAAILGYLFLWVFKNLFYRFFPRRYLRQTMAGLIILSGCYVAFTWGANDVANATGVISGIGIFSPRICVVLGGLAIIVGIVTWGYKVIETIGSRITNLVPLMAFSAQLASAVNVHAYTMLGVPVSTSHSIVGAIIGVGMFRGQRVINIHILKDIIFCWLATPFAAGIMSFIFLKIILLFVKL